MRQQRPSPSLLVYLFICPLDWGKYAEVRLTVGLIRDINAPLNLEMNCGFRSDTTSLWETMQM